MGLEGFLIKLLFGPCSGETEDAFIADLAVGVSSGQIKAGGCARGNIITCYALKMG